MKTMIDVGSETLDLNIPADKEKAIALLVSANYPASPDECLQVFAAVEDILCFALRKTVASNWRNICHVAADQAQVGGGAVVPVGVGFTIDLSAPSVAAVSKFKLHFGSKFSSTARPQTCDVNQGDLELITENGDGEPAAAVAPEDVELKGLSEKLTKESGAPVTVTLLPGKKKRGRPSKKVDTAATPATT
jgi:hypothetical protein